MRKGFGWAPAFVVGFGAGASGTVAVALLLYSGEGLLRSLALIVAIQLGAFGLGLGVGGQPSEWSDALESLRGRWLFVLMAFLGATGFVFAWDFFCGLWSVTVDAGAWTRPACWPPALCVRAPFEGNKRRADDDRAGR